MGEQVVFVWNGGPYAGALREAGYAVATSRQELANHRRRVGSRRAPMVVLAESTLGSSRFAAREGLGLIVELVEERHALVRIAICSFLSHEVLAGLDGARGEVARILAFPFIRLPATPAELADAARGAVAPSPMVQAYLRHVLDPYPFGIWLHDLNSAASGDLQQLLQGLQFLKRKVTTRREALASVVDVAAFSDLLDGGIRAAAHQDEAQSRAIFGKVQEQLRRAREEVGRARSGKAEEPERECSIAIIEDDQGECEAMRRGLAMHFSDVVAFRNGGEAIREIRRRNDEGRPFHAVVADWDLREDRGFAELARQPLQGPDVLVEVAEHCLGPLVGFTSLPRTIVASIMAEAPSDLLLRLTWYPKPSSLGNEADYSGLAHLLLERLAVARGILEETPSTTWWRDGALGREYVTRRQWARERQREFFSRCAERAEQTILDFMHDERTAGAGRRSYGLGFNQPGQGASRASWAREHFESVLTARLVVLRLCETHGTWKCAGLLAKLFSGTSARKSAKNRLALMGLPTKQHGEVIDKTKLTLMPHEKEALESPAAGGLRPFFRSEATRGVADSELCDELFLELEGLLQEVRARGISIDEPEGDDDHPWLTDEERDVLLHARTLMKLAETDGPELVRLRDSIDRLVTGGRYQPLYARIPSLKDHLRCTWVALVSGRP